MSRRLPRKINSGGDNLAVAPAAAAVAVAVGAAAAAEAAVAAGVAGLGVATAGVTQWSGLESVTRGFGLH